MAPLPTPQSIHLSLQEINSRELEPGEYGVFTTGKFHAGETSNVIPDMAEMWGTIRTTDPSGAIGEQIKKRMAEITRGIGTAMRCETQVTFYDYCPPMITDKTLAEKGQKILCELFGDDVIELQQMNGGKPGGGSEDFSFVSHRVPTIGFFLTAGNTKEGYLYGQHHPKVKYDDSVLYRGTAAYAYTALRWLELS
jgi:hippurate hydrolase